MLDINKIRNNAEEIKKIIGRRDQKYVAQVDQIQQVDKQYREILAQKEKINAEMNINSKEFIQAKNAQKMDEANKFQQKNKENKVALEQIEKQLKEVEEKLNNLLLTIPNLPHASVPFGKDETENVEVKKWGQPRKFDFQPKAHWDLAPGRLFDIERAAKLTGSRFICYTQYGAKLIRALIQFTLDFNSQAGFVEMLPQVILNANSMMGTGQLPKFEEDLFKLTNGFYLSPTAEVQLTNFFAGEILEEAELPYYLTANTGCFRSEAGSAGKDIKGVIRQHQFYKTEMVILANPKDSYEQHEFMTHQAERILEALNLPHRRIILCTGDMGFGSCKTYDLEVWLPSYNAYKEISSCSNCEDFQSRRMKLRFRNDKKEIQYVHTLNGSGVAIDRLWAAVVENYQQADGSILVPEPLQKYMNGLKVIPNMEWRKNR